jgi:CBS domain-containing protein
MPLNSPLAWAPDLEDAIERYPLVVPPTTSLVDAIALLSQAHGHTCALTDDLAASSPPARAARASCVLVMQGQELLGILTERDVVRLTAQALNFAEITVDDVMVHPVITLPQQSVQDIFAALFLFRRYRIRHLPIVDDQRQLVGVISHESIRQVLRPANLLRFRRVSDVMTTEVVRAPLTATVLQLAQLMAEHRVSCVVITQCNMEDMKQPVGIVTERDIVQFQALQIDLCKAQAQTVMSTPLFLLSPEDSLWTAHQEMQKRRVGRLVVSWNWGQGLSIITQTSLLRVFDPMEMYGVIENLQQTIQQLEGERSLTPPVSPLDFSPPPPSPPNSFHPPTRPLLPQGGVSDREDLLDLLDHAHKQVKNLMTDLDLTVDQRQSQLQLVLDTLEHLQREMRSYSGS